MAAGLNGSPPPEDSVDRSGEDELSSADSDPRLPPARSIFWIGFLAEAALLGVACLFAWLLLGHPFPFHVRLGRESILLALAATVPPALYAVFATSDIGLRFSPLRGIYDRVREFMGAVIREFALWQLLLLSLAAGFGEEFLFRGVLQERFGLLASSALFALLHAITSAYLLLAFALSVYLGWIYQIAEFNVVVPSLVHALYDAIALVLIRRKLRQE